MATLAELKTKIILQLNRDDMGSGGAMEQGLIDAITEAIEEHADTEFWFNRTSGTANTVNGTATVAIPSGMRTVQTVAYNGEDLKKVPLDDIRFRTDSGTPKRWAESDGNVRLWPTPNGVFALSFYGLAELGVPASGSSNAWTTDGLSLIHATARKILFRDYLRDPDGVELAVIAERTALLKLRGETRDKEQVEMRTEIPLLATGFERFLEI